jgi:hypothetical protein
VIMTGCAGRRGARPRLGPARGLCVPRGSTILGRASVLQNSPGSSAGHDLYSELMNS